MDVVGRAPASTVKFSALGAHPTPFLRVGINLVLLRRLGFAAFADNIERIWKRLYPNITPADIPPAFAKTFDRAAQIAIDAMAFSRTSSSEKSRSRKSSNLGCRRCR